MAISLANLRDELYPGLAEVSGRISQRIVAYQEFDRDVLVIRAGEGWNKITLEITRAEVEDGRHLPKLKSFLEMLMCAKVAGTTVSAPPPQGVREEFYVAMAATQAAARDNLLLAEMDAQMLELEKPSWPPAPQLILD